MEEKILTSSGLKSLGPIVQELKKSMIETIDVMGDISIVEKFIKDNRLGPYAASRLYEGLSMVEYDKNYQHSVWVDGYPDFPYQQVEEHIKHEELLSTWEGRCGAPYIQFQPGEQVEVKVNGIDKYSSDLGVVLHVERVSTSEGIPERCQVHSASKDIEVGSVRRIACIDDDIFGRVFVDIDQDHRKAFIESFKELDKGERVSSNHSYMTMDDVKRKLDRETERIVDRHYDEKIVAMKNERAQMSLLFERLHKQYPLFYKILNKAYSLVEFEGKYDKALNRFERMVTGHVKNELGFDIHVLKEDIDHHHNTRCNAQEYPNIYRHQFKNWRQCFSAEEFEKIQKQYNAVKTKIEIRYEQSQKGKSKLEKHVSARAHLKYLLTLPETRNKDLLRRALSRPTYSLEKVQKSLSVNVERDRSHDMDMGQAL